MLIGALSCALCSNVRAAEGAVAARDSGAGADDRIILAYITEPSFVPDFASPTGSQEGDEQIVALIRLKQYDNALKLATEAINKRPTDPVAHGLQGAAYFGKQDYASARASYSKALSLAPDSKPVTIALAQVDAEQKDFGSARARYQKLLERDPKYLPALIGMGRVEATAGNDAVSLSWLQKAKETNPDALYPRLVFANYYLGTRDYARAVEEMTQALSFHPNDPDALDLLGQAQLASGEKLNSVATFKKLALTRPDLPVAHYHLGVAQMSSGDRLGASESMRRALQLKPDYAEAVATLAELEMNAGRPAEALKLARQLQTLAPTSPAGLSIEGDSQMVAGRYGDAATAYQKALAIGDTNALAIKLHLAQTKAGKTNDADAALMQWINAHPADVGGAQYLADRYAVAGNDAAAIALYERAMKADGRNALTVNNLALLYHRQKDARALETAERAYGLAPDSARTADTLGSILVDNGQSSRGIQLLDKASSLEPKNTEIRYHLAAALAKAGDKARAKRQLETLLADGKPFPQREEAIKLMKAL